MYESLLGVQTSDKSQQICQNPKLKIFLIISLAKANHFWRLNFYL